MAMILMSLAIFFYLYVGTRGIRNGFSQGHCNIVKRLRSSAFTRWTVQQKHCYNHKLIIVLYNIYTVISMPLTVYCTVINIHHYVCQFTFHYPKLILCFADYSIMFVYITFCVPVLWFSCIMYCLMLVTHYSISIILD